MNYLAYDSINGDYEHFETIEEARDWLSESFLCDGEGYHPDLKGCRIYKVAEKADYTVVASRCDFTEEEWEEEGYSSDYEEIWKHVFLTVLKLK